MAETWWATVFSETNSRSAISALRRPSATSASDLELARRQPGGVVARRGPRAAADVAQAALAQAARDAAGRRIGAQALQLGQPSPLRGVVVGMGEGQRRLVRAAHRGPAARPPPRVAGQLEAERLGDGIALERRRRSPRARARRRARRPAQRWDCSSASTSAARSRPRSPRSRPPASAASARAAATGARRCTSPVPRASSSASSSGAHRIGIAPARAQAAEHRERGDPRRHRGVGRRQHARRRRRRRRPSAPGRARSALAIRACSGPQRQVVLGAVARCRLRGGDRPIA